MGCPYWPKMMLTSATNPESPRTGIRSQPTSLTGFSIAAFPGEQGNNPAPFEFHFFKAYGRRYRAQRQLAMRPVSCENYDRRMLTQPSTETHANIFPSEQVH